MSKKPAETTDWHPADIVAAVWKSGTSLQRLARLQNPPYCNTALTLALRKPWPKAERIIAEALGKKPHQIWPSRYHDDGTPKSGRGERGLGKHTASTAGVNDDSRAAA